MPDDSPYSNLGSPNIDTNWNENQPINSGESQPPINTTWDTGQLGLTGSPINVQYDWEPDNQMLSPINIVAPNLNPITSYLPSIDIIKPVTTTIDTYQNQTPNIVLPPPIGNFNSPIDINSDYNSELQQQAEDRYNEVPNNQIIIPPIPDDPTSDVDPNNMPPVEVPSSDIEVNDMPPAEVPPSNIEPNNMPPVEVPPSDIEVNDMPPVEVPPSDIEVNDMPPVEVPPSDVDPNDMPPPVENETPPDNNPLEMSPPVENETPPDNNPLEMPPPVKNETPPDNNPLNMPAVKTPTSDVTPENMPPLGDPLDAIPEEDPIPPAIPTGQEPITMDKQTEEIEELGEEGDRNADVAINKIKAKIGASDKPETALNALASKLEKKKDAVQLPLRTMTDEQLAQELQGIVPWNAMDPQIDTEGSNKKRGDFYSLMQYGTRKDLTDYYKTIEEAHPQDNDLIDHPKTGMPFYFKDLRDGAFIFFRAYLDGITDSITPSWNSENYIGRSEPVYTYTNAEREISFKLKVFAQTSDELDAHYMKLNKLTSLCYPQYKKHETVVVNNETLQVGGIGNKERMKPPLTKLRLGELFGDKNDELTGFIKSLTYTFPDESPWEIKRGKRVPKYIEIDFSYQVIHGEVPSLDMAKMTREGNPENTFYGIAKTIYKEEKERRNW